MSRSARTATAALALAAVLTGCGAPPEPLPSSPPRPRPSVSEPPPSAGLPSLGGTLPTQPLPGATLPGATVPTLPTVVTTSPSPTPPPPAPLCTGGPTKQQVIDLVKGKPGIPTEPMQVRQGPYCAGSWQFSILGLVDEGDDPEEELLVVSNGRPSSLKLVEAGADVCSDRVARDAPAGVRVRACGS